MDEKVTLYFILMTGLIIHNVIGGVVSPEQQGLYDVNDKLTILNVTNFERKVFGTVNAWLIEFYNSWCGYCIRFAPTWKELAADIYDWRKVVTVGVVDCANDENNPLCRNYDVMRYPTLKLFPQQTHPKELGTALTKEKTVNEIRQGVVDLLEKEQVEGRGSQWPNLTPYRSSDSNNLWKEASPSVKFTFLICESPDSYVGREVILDFSDSSEIQIRRVTSNNEVFMKLLEVREVPSLVAMHRDHSIVHLNVVEGERKAFREAIRAFLLNGEGTQKGDAGAEYGELRVVSEGKRSEKFLDSPDATKQDVVYQADLVKAMMYTLKHEIPLHKVITGDTLTALQNFVTVLAKYFPSDAQGSLFLEKLRRWVLDKDDAIKGETFMDQVNALEKETRTDAINSQDWVSCKGSQSRLRGYPCGLWTMFHTLTVNHALQKDVASVYNPLEVLTAMLGYIKYFFGCANCSEHFQEMAAESMHAEVMKGYDGVMWLWKSHNKVNARLKGDETEDPEHPKIQFPSEVNCPTCRNKDRTWNTREVLKYLKKMYSKDNVNYEGLKVVGRRKRTWHVGNKLSPANQDAVRGNIKNINSLSVNDAALIVDQNVGQEMKRKSGWDFNLTDISLCVILYICSAAILILVYIKFIMKKRYKKKHYLYDLLGKV